MSREAKKPKGGIPKRKSPTPIFEMENGKRKSVDLSNVPTRRLLSWKNSIYTSGVLNEERDEYGFEFFGTPIYITEIIAELNKREHIPNKQDTRKARQDKARAGR